MRDMLTINEAAELLGVKSSTIRSWVFKREKLTVVRLGRAVRIPRSSIQQLIEESTVPPARC
jgi:excisionase family DNA binding protein